MIPERLRSADIRYLVNPTGRFEIGGPLGDTGLTGRKIIVDTYGGSCPHGGGAFSGKDPTKVDRSAAYAARQVAKPWWQPLSRAGARSRSPMPIGVADPVSLYVVDPRHGSGAGRSHRGGGARAFDLRPAGIIERLQLRRPIFSQTSAYGHFGREGVTWEDTALAGRLRERATEA